MFNFFKKLTWPQVAVMNLTILGFATYVFIQGMMAETTRTTSQAAPVEPTPTPIPAYPVTPPIITAVEYFFAKPGDQVRIRGQHFGAAQWQSTLSIGTQPLPPEAIINWSNEAIDFTVPEQAVSNPVSLTVNRLTVTGPVLSIYSSAADPQITLIPSSEGYTLNLRNAPPGASLTLRLADNSPRTFSIHTPEMVLFSAPVKPTLIHASLENQNKTYLPLFADPSSL